LFHHDAHHFVTGHIPHPRDYFITQMTAEEKITFLILNGWEMYVWSADDATINDAISYLQRNAHEYVNIDRDELELSRTFVVRITSPTYGHFAHGHIDYFTVDRAYALYE
jgi:hypothetical protein